MQKVEIPVEGRGRSQKKRAAKAVEQLAQHLADLPEAEIGKLGLSPELDTEVQLARNTRGHGSRKRQIKHLAGFLRRSDEEREKVETALEGVTQTQRRDAHAFQNLEDLRQRLCDPKTFQAALHEVETSYPELDLNKLAGLARSVHTDHDKKAYREIFRRLRKAKGSDQIPV